MSSIVSKSEFYNAAMAEMIKYPALAARIAAGDVTITQQFGAMASMLSMLSYQIGIAETEVWEKTRDSMVLADAAIKGILPMGVAASYSIYVNNQSSSELRISSGRRLLDNQGRIWRVVDGASIPANGSDNFNIQQVDLQQITHTVTEKKNLYRFKIPQPASDTYLCSINLHEATTLQAFSYVHEFTNISEEQRVFQVIVDELQDMYIQFGVADVAGYVPDVGESFVVTVGYTNGEATLSQGSPLSFEYINTGVNSNENQVSIESGNMINAGAYPRSLDELRELAKYPFVYDQNAVFLGEFEFLIAKNIRGFSFLSVWNEQKEEEVRGASVDNINTLNVAFINSSYSNTQLQNKIKEVIARADDSYKVRFFDVVEQPIPLTVKLRLANIYDDADVMRQVVDWLVAKYGYNSEFAKLGNRRINWQLSIKGIRESISQLNDGVSDISIYADETEVVNPEVYRFVTKDSINISNLSLDSYSSYS